MQINSEQMEARILLKRTCDRTANLNPYFLKYLRSNHDVTVLIDVGHSMRYATKYAAKSGRCTDVLNEVIDYINKRTTDDPTTKCDACKRWREHIQLAREATDLYKDDSTRHWFADYSVRSVDLQKVIMLNLQKVMPGL
jgi:hypothetical protein